MSTRNPRSIAYLAAFLALVSLAPCAGMETHSTEPVRFIRGDCDGNGKVGGNVTEALILLDWLFQGGDEPPCLAACDMNADGTVSGNPTDAILILRYSFRGGETPAAPFPNCGSGTEDDAALGCETPSEACSQTEEGFVAPELPTDVGTHRLVVHWEDTPRSIIVILPITYEDSDTYPLMFALHGGGGGANKFMENHEHLVEDADAAGVVLVFPQGSPTRGGAETVGTLGMTVTRRMTSASSWR